MRIKLTIITIIAAILVAPYSFADNAKTTTSQGYVDTQIATKQDKVPAVDTNTVITTTGTTGEIGEKAIYDANGNYAEQTDALVTAADANAAVQNAIDTEFVCIEWAPNTAETPENCYIWKIQNQTAHPSSKNLFNLQKSQVLYSSDRNNQAVKNSDGWTVRFQGASNTGYSFVLIEVGDIHDFLGKTLTVSAKVSCINGAQPYYQIGSSNDNGTERIPSKRTIVIPESLDGISSTKVVIWLYSNAGAAATNPECTYYDIQVEEGNVATEYEPYQNLYLPTGN